MPAAERRGQCNEGPLRGDNKSHEKGGPESGRTSCVTVIRPELPWVLQNYG